MLLLKDSANRVRVRATDFHPSHPFFDPTVTLFHAFIFSIHHTTQAPPFITSDTPPPTNAKRAQKYPDATQWAMAHDTELDQLEQQNTIIWLTSEEVPRNCRPIRLTMTISIPEYLMARYQKEKHVVRYEYTQCSPTCKTIRTTRQPTR